MRLLIATTNRHKLREIRGLLAATGAEVVGLESLPPIPEPDETGDTFAENARLKALYYERESSDRSRLQDTAAGAGESRPQILTVAEDSGLVIDALGGEPGVHSARFLGAEATYPQRFQEIYRRLDACPGCPRTARFVCALAAAQQGRIVFEATGTVEGEIADAPRGEGGFGYDPIFYYPEYRATLAEVTEPEKLRVAHRGQAFRALARWLERLDLDG